MLNLRRVVGIVFVLIGLSLAIASFGISVGQLAVVSGGLVVTIGQISMPTSVALGSGLAMMLFGAVTLHYSRNRGRRLLQQRNSTLAGK